MNDQLGIEEGVGFDVHVDVRITDPLAAAARNLGTGPDEHGDLGLVGPSDDVGRVREALPQVFGDALRQANATDSSGFIALRCTVRNSDSLGGDAYHISFGVS